jgi:hypothetical protein
MYQASSQGCAKEIDMAKAAKTKTVVAKAPKPSGSKKHKVMVEFITTKAVSKSEACQGLQKLFDERLDLEARPLFECNSDVEVDNVYGEGLRVVEPGESAPKTEVSKR